MSTNIIDAKCDIKIATLVKRDVVKIGVRIKYDDFGICGDPWIILRKPSNLI